MERTCHPFPILFAEDNAISRKIVESHLGKAGYEITSVKNGRKAFELFRKNFFPIVLTDWMMPEMDGLELCRAVRNHESEGYVYIILLTSNDKKDQVVSGFEAGADDYLIKPPDPAELIARIKTGIRVLELEGSLKKANEKNRILSITDPLTGCYNRGYLMEQLPREIRRVRRYGHPLSLGLCDIDHFKKVNDTYGHQTGDKVLQIFIKCVRDTIRESMDWVARYGGEEFMVACPETDMGSAQVMMERLRETVAQRSIKAGDTEIHITVSFGLTSFDSHTPDNNVSAENMIRQADRLLYHAKNQGRNRIQAGAL